MVTENVTENLPRSDSLSFGQTLKVTDRFWKDLSVTQHGVCWNTGGTPTIADSKTEEGATGAGAFESLITNLIAGTLYFVRAYAGNVYGTSYGGEVTFTTVVLLVRAGYIWMEGSNLRGFDESEVERMYIHTDDVDDTVVDGVTTFPASSNWAFDHNALNTASFNGTKILIYLDM